MSRASLRAAFALTLTFAALVPLAAQAQPSRPAPTRPAPRRPVRPLRPGPRVPTPPEATAPEPTTPTPPTEPVVAPPDPIAAPPPEAPVVTPVPEVPPVASPAPPQPRPTSIDIEVGPRLFGRSLFFTDDVFQQLRPYSLPLAPAVSGALEFYPGALVSSGLASWFGIVARGDLGIALSSRDAQGRAYTTTAYAFMVGARMRVRFWRAEAALTLAYDAQTFSLQREDAGRAPPDGIPNVAYQSLRVGLSTRVQLVPRFAIRASGAWLAVLDAGEFSEETFFPRVSGGGVEATLGVAFAIMRHFEVRLDGDWRRYYFSMNPIVGDRLVAGGAADDYYGATLSIAFRR